MSDTTDTTTGEAEAPAAEAPAAEAGGAPATDAPPALPAAEPAKVRFWDRPYVDRYLAPFLLPIAVVVGVVVYILNVSRLFLSAPGHFPVVIASIITVTILLGATMLATSPRLRSSSIVLLTVAFIALIISAGSVNLGHSQPKGASTGPLACTLGASKTLTFEAGPNGALKFAPDSGTATTGLVRIELTDGAAAPHTFNFDNQATQFKDLQVNTTGEKDSCVAFFPSAGDYTFFCNIPGHRAAGMQGTIHVTGPTMTLAQAEAAAPKGAGGASPTT